MIKGYRQCPVKSMPDGWHGMREYQCCSFCQNYINWRSKKKQEDVNFAIRGNPMHLARASAPIVAN